MTRIKALTVLQTSDLVRARHGDEVVERVKAAMSDEARHAIYESALMPTDWIELAHAANNLVAFEQVMGTGDGTEARRLVRALAAEHFTGLYRMLLAISSPRGLIEKSRRIWTRYYDRGENVAEDVTSHSGTLRILGCPDLPRHHDWIVLPYTEEILSRAGAKDVVSEHTQCVATGADSCISRFSWK
jgi:hypothetical protein